MLTSKNIKFHPYKAVLKNGITITIRQAETKDAKELTQTVRTYLADSDFIPLSQDEFNPTIEQEISWIKAFITKENSLLLVATHKGKIIGNIDLTGNQRIALSHTANIGMGMLKEFRNIGLGTALLNSCVQWAKQNPILEKLLLQVYANNLAGLSLYKKAGFMENGIQHKYFKHEGTLYFDNIYMSLDV